MYFHPPPVLLQIPIRGWRAVEALRLPHFEIEMWTAMVY